MWMVVSKGKNVVDQDQSSALLASTNMEDNPNKHEEGGQHVQLASGRVTLGKDGSDTPLATPSIETQTGTYHLLLTLMLIQAGLSLPKGKILSLLLLLYRPIILDFQRVDY